jgi:NADH-quinone oxidoreductase subunit N
VGKFALFGEAMAASGKDGSPGLTWLVALAAVMSAISLYYYLSILKQAFVNDGPDGGSGATMGAAHVLAVGLPALALVIFGIFPALLLDPITAAVVETLGLR